MITPVTLRPTGAVDEAWLRGFLQARLVPGLERVDGTSYERSVWIDERPIVLTVRFVARDNQRADLQASARPALPEPALGRLVTDLFDLDADVAAFRRVVRADAPMKRLVDRRPGLRLTRFLDPFEGLVRAIVGQQVSLGGARTTLARLVERFGRRMRGQSLAAFPTPRRIRDAGRAAIESVGLTGTKTRSLLAAAESSLDGRLDWSVLRRAGPDEAQAMLVALDGVGPWTAAYVRMRVLGDRDAFPESDLGVVKAASALMNHAGRLTPRDVRERAEGWRPWRAYATLHLWSSLGDPSRKGRRAGGDPRNGWR